MENLFGEENQKRGELVVEALSFDLPHRKLCSAANE